MAKGKEYHRWYNRVRRGRPEPRERYRYRCMVCGNLAYWNSLERMNRLEVMKQYGFNYSFIDPNNPREVKTLEDYVGYTAEKMLGFMKIFIQRGVLSRDYIAESLGLVKVIKPESNVGADLLSLINSGATTESKAEYNNESRAEYGTESNAESRAEVKAWVK